MIIVTIYLGICIFTPVFGGEIPTLNELREMDSLEIIGATVSQASDALNIANKAYFIKAGGIMANEGAGSPSIITMGYDVPRFVSAGEQLWEVRISVLTPNNTLALRAILWINPRTEKVHFVCGPWDSFSAEESD